MSKREASNTLLFMNVTGFYRLMKTWGMDPGLEFKVAMEEAERLRATLVYGDADQDHTIRRISHSLSAQVLYFPDVKHTSTILVAKGAHVKKKHIS